MYKKISIIAILVFIFFIVSNNISYAGFGVSPGSINEENLVPGSHFETIIYLVQGDPKKDINMGVSVDSGDMEEWISFENGTEFTIPAGVQQYPLRVIIDVPENVELGIYKAFIRATVVPDLGTEDGQVSIAIGGRVDLEFIIGDNVVESYEIIKMDILDILGNEDPTISVNIKNTGNVSAGPSLASFELFNKFASIRLGFAESDKFERVKSFSKEEQILNFPIDIRFAPGEYWGHAKIYDDSGKIIKELKTVFNVKEQTFINKYGTSIAIIVGVIILALILLFVISRRFKKKGIKRQEKTAESSSL